METTVSHSVTLAMPRAQAWRKLRDLSLAHRYVPGLVKTELHAGPREGVGASRRVFQRETRWIDETVIEWRDGHGFVIRLHREQQGAPAPFAAATFRYWLEDEGATGTRLTTTLAYTTRWGALGRLFDRLVLTPAIGRNVRAVAERLKVFYEGGDAAAAGTP
jgi:hypothetical protein